MDNWMILLKDGWPKLRTNSSWQVDHTYTAVWDVKPRDVIDLLRSL